MAENSSFVPPVVSCKVPRISLRAFLFPRPPTKSAQACFPSPPHETCNPKEPISVQNKLGPMCRSEVGPLREESPHTSIPASPGVPSLVLSVSLPYKGCSVVPVWQGSAGGAGRRGRNVCNSRRNETEPETGYGNWELKSLGPREAMELGFSALSELKGTDRWWGVSLGV